MQEELGTKAGIYVVYIRANMCTVGLLTTGFPLFLGWWFTYSQCWGESEQLHREPVQLCVEGSESVHDREREVARWKKMDGT